MTIEIELIFNSKKFIKKIQGFNKKKSDIKCKMNKDDKKM